MYVYFVDGYKPDWMTVTQAPYIERDLQVHQVYQWWFEHQITRKYQFYSHEWNELYLALDGTDASSIVQDTVMIFTDRPAGYIEYNVKEAMDNWKSGNSNNHGLIVRATNEDII